MPVGDLAHTQMSRHSSKSKFVMLTLSTCLDAQKYIVHNRISVINNGPHLGGVAGKCCKYGRALVLKGSPIRFDFSGRARLRICLRLVGSSWQRTPKTIRICTLRHQALLCQTPPKAHTGVLQLAITGLDNEGNADHRQERVQADGKKIPDARDGKLQRADPGYSFGSIPI